MGEVGVVRVGRFVCGVGSGSGSWIEDDGELGDVRDGYGFFFTGYAVP